MSSTTVYGVSVDSRSRNPGEADNNYTVQLQRMLDRVKSVQLGSFQFQDARYAFDNAQLKYSEPLFIPPDTYVRFEETTRVVTKATGAVHQSVRTVTMFVPPTMNPITAMDNLTQHATTTHHHGLFFGVHYYPRVGLRMQLIGGDFPQDLQNITTPSFPTDSPRPVLTSTTLASYPDSKSFTWAPDYLNQLTNSVGNAALRVVDAPNYHSYVHAPRPTLVELFTMLNAAVGDMTARSDRSGTIAAASNTTPILVSTPAAHGLATGDQVTIASVTGNLAANGTFFITSVTSHTFHLDGSVGNGVYTGGGTWVSPQCLKVPVTFGFDNVDNTVVATAPTRTLETLTTLTTTSSVITGPLATLLGFRTTHLDPPAIATVPVIRTVPLKSGNFTAAEVAANTTHRLNPGDFTLFNPTERTLHYTLPSGAPATLVLDVGRYTGVQLAAWMSVYLSYAHIGVTYNSNGTFTFRHALGLPFALDFQASGALMAERLGFDPNVYASASTYTSARPALFDAHVSTNQYALLVDELTKHYTFYTTEPLLFYTTSGTSTPGIGQQWVPLVDDGLRLAHTAQPGDIIMARRPTLSGVQGGAKSITDVSNTTPIIVTTANAHGLVNGDNVTLELVQGNTAANGTWFVDNVTPTTYELVSSRGDGIYTAATGRWWTNMSLVAGTQKPGAVYEVVVASAWDASTGTPLLTLQPTASVFATQDAGVPNRVTLGTPALTDGLILMASARRNVFMLHFEHPEGAPATFGFPSMAWPPSQRAMIARGNAISDLSRLPKYNPTTLGVPVSSSYTSPFAWNLDAPDYILISIHVQQATFDLHSHSYRGQTTPIFAKLLVNNPYVNISEELHFTTFAGNGRFNQLSICFLNPDGTLVNFNGQSHSFTLLFTLHEDSAVLPCI